MKINKRLSPPKLSNPAAFRKLEVLSPKTNFSTQKQAVTLEPIENILSPKEVQKIDEVKRKRFIPESLV